MNGLWNWISGLVFPARCLGCGAYDSFLCAPCRTNIPIRHHEECIVCKRRRIDGGPCSSCRTHTMIDRLLIGGYADHPLLRELIHRFKYTGMTGLAAPLADYLISALSRRTTLADAFVGNPLLVPVPLHPSRRRERGFNQSELLTTAIATRVSMAHAIGALERVRATGSQVDTSSRWDRLDNMRDAFACPDPSLVADRDIILIDDVCTTGATLDACAAALKDAGARSVTAIVLARG